MYVGPAWVINQTQIRRVLAVIIRWDLLSLRSHRDACRRFRAKTCVSRIKMDPAWIESINYTHI